MCGLERKERPAVNEARWFFCFVFNRNWCFLLSTDNVDSTSHCNVMDLQCSQTFQILDVSFTLRMFFIRYLFVLI